MEQLTPPASLTDTAKETLKRAIMKGELHPGPVFSEQAVAAQMGISKTPVHNALLELETKGFVSILPRRGFVVNRLSQQELVELFEYRKALECAVVENLTRNQDPDGLAQLQALLEEHLSSDNSSDFSRLDRRFHEKMAELCANRFIIESLSNIWDMVEWLGVNSLRNAMNDVHLQDSADRMEHTRQEHQGLLSAVEQGGPAQAKAAVLHHLNRVEKRYLDMWEDLSPDPGKTGSE